MFVFFSLPPPTAAAIPTTSAPYTTIYKLADVPQHPSSPKTNAYRRSWSSSAIQTDAGVSKIVPEVDPSMPKTTPQSHIPGKSQNQVPWKEDTNKNILASLPAVSQAGPLKQNQGIRSGPSQTNPASLKNISEVTPGQVQSELPNISNTIAKTVGQASGRGVPTLGKSYTETAYRSKRP